MRVLKVKLWNAKDKLMSKPIDVLKSDMKSVIFDEARQFTGLLDKLGKEIYEGDICKFNQVIGFIKYHNGRFEFRELREMTGEGISGENTTKNFKVIGNIYENKDLIKNI